MLDGHLVEENGEDTLLHLTSILGTQDDHLLGGEVDGDGGGGGHALGVSVGREGSGIVDGVVGVEVFELLTRRADEHVPHEQSMVGASADDTDADSVLLVPASIAINDVDAVAGVEVVDSTLSVDLPDLKSIIVSTYKLASLIISLRHCFTSCPGHRTGNYTPANQPANSFVGGRPWTLPARLPNPASRARADRSGPGRDAGKCRQMKGSITSQTSNANAEPRVCVGRPLMVGYPIRSSGAPALFLFCRDFDKSAEQVTFLSYAGSWACK